MFLDLFAYLSVFSLVQVRVRGETHATITVREFPPNASCSRRVSLSRGVGSAPFSSPLVVLERADDVPEREQAFADPDALLKTRARPRRFRAGAGEVHEVHPRASRRPARPFSAPDAASTG